MTKKIFFFALFLGCFLPVLSYGQVQVAPFVNPSVQFFNNSGAPCNACTLDAFAAGTTTRQDTYSDSAGTTANANPIVLDSNGRATIFLSSSSYKFVLKTAQGSTLFTIDNVTWNNLAQTLTSLTANGTLQVIPSTAA